MKYFFKISISIYILLLLLLTSSFSVAQDESFEQWLFSYKKSALKNGVSKNTIDIAFKNVKFVEQIIKYDRKQPEFFEDTITYVSKRANLLRVRKAKELLNKNIELFTQVEKEFNVEKEILLALWGIETNFGKHVGKMDIISALATLSYDMRRRDFFSNQLLILLKLIDKKIVTHEELFGSWAGAYGNFQFMPSTINSYAIDYDNNNIIELKNSLNDSLASAANYINKIGWMNNTPCFLRVKIKNKIKEKYINKSARNISNRFTISKWKKLGVLFDENINLDQNYKAALILPDGKVDSPTFLVFHNYEKILNWNRSLRFAISVCTLAEMIKS
jgi:membrane-bound lytic murein transglycosylase B